MKLNFFVLSLLVLMLFSCQSTESDFVDVNDTPSVTASCVQDRVSSNGTVFTCSVDLSESIFGGGLVVFGSSQNPISVPPAFQEIAIGTNAGSPNPEMFSHFPEGVDDSHFFPDVENFDVCGSGYGHSYWNQEDALSVSDGYILEKPEYTLNSTSVDFLKITVDPSDVSTNMTMNIGGVTVDGDFWHAKLKISLEDNSSFTTSINIVDMSAIDVDFNNDGQIGSSDLLDFHTHVGSSNILADFDSSGVVDCYDLMLFTQKFNNQ